MTATLARVARPAKPRPESRTRCGTLGGVRQIDRANARQQPCATFRRMQKDRASIRPVGGQGAIIDNRADPENRPCASMDWSLKNRLVPRRSPTSAAVSTCERRIPLATARPDERMPREADFGVSLHGRAQPARLHRHPGAGLRRRRCRRGAVAVHQPDEPRRLHAGAGLHRGRPVAGQGGAGDHRVLARQAGVHPQPHRRRGRRRPRT